MEEKSVRPNERIILQHRLKVLPIPKLSAEQLERRKKTHCIQPLVWYEALLNYLPTLKLVQPYIRIQITRVVFCLAHPLKQLGNKIKEIYL